MDSLMAFLNGLLGFALEAVRLFIGIVIYILSFILSLLQQLLGAVV